MHSMITRFQFAVASCFLLTLTACGGGSSSGASSSNGGSSASSSNGGGSVTTGSSGASATSVLYASAVNPTSPSDLLAQLNSEGANGYTWFTPVALTGDGGAEFAIYAKTGTATYTYEVLTMPTTLPDTLAQANSEGARGFARVTPVMAGITNGIPNDVIIYRHTVGSSAAYTYESLATPTTDAGFLTQANAEGARGFFFGGVAAVMGGATAALYANDSSSAARYAYTAQPLNNSSAAFLTQANAQGALGYKFYGAFFFTGQTSSIYVKDTTQSAQFTYSSQAAVTQVSNYVSQANAQGANGLRLYGELQFGSTPQNFYFLPQNCTGLLCAPSGTF